MEGAEPQHALIQSNDIKNSEIQSQSFQSDRIKRSQTQTHQEEVIMSSADFFRIKEQFRIDELESLKLTYRVR